MAGVMRCSQCGAIDKFIRKTDTVYVCDSCNTTLDYNYYQDETRINLNQALLYRQTAKFEEAKTLYNIIKSNLSNEKLMPEVYFGLFACEYKVLFELDNATGKQVPVFYSSSETSVYDSENLQKALKQAKSFSENKYNEYIDLAEKVEYARTRYLKIEKLTNPFDIFICFKKSKPNSVETTKDYEVAMSLYQNLITTYGSKYNIFMSEQTLAKLPITEYEPNIYYALHTSKVMLVVSSHTDYLESQWVKNEWSRFLAINKTSAVIPIILEGSSVNVLPAELKRNNAYDEKDYDRIFSAIDAIMNSDENLRLKKEQENKIKDSLYNHTYERIIKDFKMQHNSVDSNELIKRVKIELRDGYFEKAEKLCDQILNSDAEQPLGWFYLYLSKEKIKGIDLIQSIYDKSWTSEREIKNAIEFSSKERYKEERKFVEEEIYKWIKYTINEVTILKNARRYSDAKAKLILIAAQAEEFGKDQRFLYYYNSFLIELNCLDIKDIVSSEGLYSNKNFEKASKYASVREKVLIDEIIQSANENSNIYQKVIDKNNMITDGKMRKLDEIYKNKISEYNQKIDEYRNDDIKIENEISNLKVEKNKLIEDVKKEQLKSVETKDLFYQNNFGKQQVSLSILLNIRSIVVGVIIYYLIFLQFYVKISINYNLTILLILAIIYTLNLLGDRYSKNNKSIWGILSFIIKIFAIPFAIGYPRRYIIKRKNKKYEKHLKAVLLHDEAVKKIEDDYMQLINQRNRKMMINEEKTDKLNLGKNNLDSRKQELENRFGTVELNNGIYLKEELEKKNNLFTQNILQLEQETLDISDILVI